MKKVLLIHPRFLQLGGLEQRLINYSNFFLSKGWEVHIACRRYDRTLVKPGIKIHQFQPWFFNSTNKNYLFNKKLEQWKKPVFDFELSLGRNTIQKNIIAPATHIGFMNGIGKKEKSKADKLYIEMDMNGYQSSQYIWAASKMVKDEITNYYNIEEKKISILHPPFDISKHKKKLPEEKELIRNKLQLPKNKIYHLFVSSAIELKGIDLLTRVFKQLINTNHVLLVVGEKFKPDSPNIFSLGYYKDISMAYALGDYLLHPSKYDAFAQVVSEALFYQIPVVVSNNTGAKEIISTQTGRIIPELNVDLWVDTIRSLPETQFDIPSDIIQQLGLDIQSHMQKMLKQNNLE